MITFEPLRNYMDKHNRSLYELTRAKIVGGVTLDMIKADGQRVTLYTVDRICEYLRVKPSTVFRYIPGDVQPAAPPDHTTDE